MTRLPAISSNAPHNAMVPRILRRIDRTLFAGHVAEFLRGQSVGAVRRVVAVLNHADLLDPRPHRQTSGFEMTGLEIKGLEIKGLGFALGFNGRRVRSYPARGE
jgi:hypothetical protein